MDMVQHSINTQCNLVDTMQPASTTNLFLRKHIEDMHGKTMEIKHTVGSNWDIAAMYPQGNLKNYH
jgi:hypothetical protein